MQSYFTRDAARRHPLSARGSFRSKSRQIGALAGFALTGLLSATSHAQIVNPVSHFDIKTDGMFTGGVSPTGMLMGEWSDITPAAFISPPTDAGPLLSVPVGDPRANSLLYAGIDPGKDNLYLMYDYLPRTNPNFFSNEKIATIAFPVDLPKGGVFGNSGRRLIDVEFFRAPFGIGAIGGGINVRVNIHSDATATDSAFDVDASVLGLTGALAFGPSTLSQQNHLLIELEVPLEIPAGFGNGNTVFNPNGQDPVSGGSVGYSPDPAFWGGNFANNLIDPPGSAALFQILPNGNTLITPLGAVPEPSAWAVGVCSALTGLLAFRRSRKRR